jgi:hypothetical protein
MSWLWTFAPQRDATPPATLATPALGDPEAAPIDRIRLGREARQILEAPVLALAFQRMERRIAATLFATEPLDTQARERCYDRHWAVQTLKSELRALMNDARVLEAEQKLQAAEDERAEARRRRALEGG